MNVRDTPEASETPVEEVATTSAQEAPVEITEQEQPEASGAPVENGTSEQDEQVEGVLESFKLEDVPEELREHVGRYVKQVQGDFTRKTQTLAQQRKEVEAEQAEAETALALYRNLESEDTRDDAIRELVEGYGYSYAAAEAAADAAGDEEPQAEGQMHDPRLDQFLAEHEADREAQAAADELAGQEAHREAVMDHVDESLDLFAESEGVDELKPAQRRQIIALAAGMDRDQDGLPDMAGAITEYEALRAADVEAYLASKRSAVPDVSGSSGTPTFDPRDEKQRLAAANRTAEAAMARHR